MASRSRRRTSRLWSGSGAGRPEGEAALAGNEALSLGAARIGAALRATRLALGVDLTAVQDRTGVPAGKLHAVESGDLSCFVSAAEAADALRRFAELVGLDAAPFVRMLTGATSPVQPSTTPTQALVGVGTATNVLIGAEPEGSAVSTDLPAGTWDEPGAFDTAAGVLALTGAETNTARGSAAAGTATGVPGDTFSLAGTRTRLASTASLGRSAGFFGPAGPDGHLGSFTETAEVPAISPRSPDSAPTPRTRTRSGLRRAVWVTVVVLAVAVAGLVIEHWRPRYLDALHAQRISSFVSNVRKDVVSVVSSGSSSPAPKETGGTPSAPRPSSVPLVSTSSTGSASATVRVRAASYGVVVAAFESCWVQVTTSAQSAPSFTGVLAAGSHRTFGASAGQPLEIELGASHVIVTIQIAGKPVGSWFLAPTQVPFDAKFVSEK